MRTILHILFIIGAMVFISCGSDDGSPTPGIPQAKQEEVTQLLTGTSAAKTWKIQTLTVDGVDETSTVKGMTIKFVS